MVLGIFNRDKVYKPSDRIDKYTLVKVIGEGRYGICYQVSFEQKLFILKQLKRGMLRKAGQKAQYEEEILLSLQYESIPRFIERLEYQDFCGYVLEFKEGKTFEELIYLEKHVFTREEIYRIGVQLVGILKCLHSRGVVHRDIRAPNTLYDGKKVNLVDFGLARWANNQRYRVDVDFAFLGDFLLHLYYSSFELKRGKKLPWYEELKLSQKELCFLKRLMGIEQRYQDINEVEQEFYETFDKQVH